MPCSFLEQGGRWGSKKAINLEISAGMANLREKLSFSLSVVSDPWTVARQASPSFTVSRSLLKLMSTESVMPFNHLVLCCPLLLPQSFPASGSFPVSQLFASGGQSIGALASVLPTNIQGWFSLGLIGLISLLSKELLRFFSSTTVWKH